MRIFTLPEQEISSFGSSGITMSFLPQMGQSTGTKVHVATFGAAGGLGAHPAPVWQIFAVLEGAGEVRSDLGTGTHEKRWHPIRAGQAVLWEPGEVHESRATTGMRVVIVESRVEPDLGEEFRWN